MQKCACAHDRVKLSHDEHVSTVKVKASSVADVKGKTSTMTDVKGELYVPLYCMFLVYFNPFTSVTVATAIKMLLNRTCRHLKFQCIKNLQTIHV